jgi:outer membrane immunogenic protein
MRTLGIGALSLALMSSSAYAADAILYQDPPPAPVLYDSFVWTGFYAGAQAGYAFAGSTYIEYPSDDDYDYDLSPRGWFGGLHAGYNHQFGSGLVLGVEGDVNWGRVKASGASSDDYTADFISTG